MRISGLQKMTLLDYPGKIACTVFLGGCNFRCPFCHNGELLDGTVEPIMSVQELLDFLSRRRGLLDAVCISGGEPTLQQDLATLLEKIRQMDYLVKLDTNGSRPEVVKELVEKKLVDYIAMDVKNSPKLYPQTAGLETLDLEAVEESLRFLIGGDLDYELRTTLVAQLHDLASVQEMGQWLAGLVPGKKAKKLFLQSFTDRDTVLFAGLSAPEPEVTAQFAKILSPFVETISIRNP